eukprot:TRINITY_DN2966_c0_g1_i5.p1 TRINITY_DN2966_c0_g1~~TRINITY_DN2966_c0_g1_i5.p1  ORF type:complete len:560 (+),score=101.65 TRINITY_DN2966_c0_g1_i5:887-2566(+)
MIKARYHCLSKVPLVLPNTRKGIILSQQIPFSKLPSFNKSRALSTLKPLLNKQHILLPNTPKILRSTQVHYLLTQPKLFHLHSRYYATSTQQPLPKFMSSQKPPYFLMVFLLMLYFAYNLSDNRYDDDTEEIYKTKKTKDILFSYLILKVCSFQTLVKYSPQILEMAEKFGLMPFVNSIMKHTFFKNFCAGETIAETEGVVDELKTLGIGAILNYSVEEVGGGKVQFDKITDDIIRTINIASTNPSLAFSCAKLSGLCSLKLLQHISDIIIYEQNKTGVAPPPLSKEEQEEYKDLLGRLDKICDISVKAGVPILIDAEQTWYQPAIDNITLTLCKKYNVQRPIVYNTYQMYRKDSIERLNKHIKEARERKYKLGVKLVRGAYMASERENAQLKGVPSPILDSIVETHTSFNEGMDLVLKNLDTTGIVIATHNENSVKKGIELLKSEKISPLDTRVQFAQLYGMADYLTLEIANNGQRVFKYVPFGPIEDVMPYLIRRLQENTGFMGSTSAKEVSLLRKELFRRFWSFFSFIPLFGVKSKQSSTPTVEATPSPAISPPKQ